MHCKNVHPCEKSSYSIDVNFCEKISYGVEIN